MVKIKKDTISREAFEKEMESLKSFVTQNPTDSRTIVQAINDKMHKLIEYIDERDAELFRIPEWMNDVTVSVRKEDME